MASGGASGGEELWRRHQSTDGAAACTDVTDIHWGECKIESYPNSGKIAIFLLYGVN